MAMTIRLALWNNSSSVAGEDELDPVVLREGGGDMGSEGAWSTWYTTYDITEACRAAGYRRTATIVYGIYAYVLYGLHRHPGIRATFRSKNTFHTYA